MFSTLFSNPEALRELYSAIEGVDVPHDAVISINTLSDALFMGKINDVSFTIDDRIVVLLEHQSTLSENIPIRLLMYIARVYEKIVEKENIYHRRVIKIPTPEFIVLYNGKENCLDHQELKLSAAFKDTTGLKPAESNKLQLELTVQVYNINHGRNPEILSRSAYLDEYSFFIKIVNDFNEHLSLDESLKSAVKYCIERNVLKEFLEEHSSEVINMLFEEVTIEEIAEIRYKEGREEGIEKGRYERDRTIARKMKNAGRPISEIEEFTGLTFESIKEL